MRRYNYFQSLPLAFYSRSLYRDVGQQWRGAGIWYILLLAFICTLIFGFRLGQLGYYGFTDVKSIVVQLPTLTITKGILSIDKPEPYFIKDPQSNRVLAIIDTSGQYTSLTDTSAFVLLTQNKIFTRHGETIKQYVLPDVHRIYTPEKIIRFLGLLMYVFVVVACLLAWLCYFILGLLESFLYAGLAKLLLHTGLTYKTLYRLAAVSLTPAFILAAILSLFAIQFPYRWLIYILLPLAYLIYAIRVNWEKS